MRELPQPARDEIDLAQVMHALSDPVRLALVAKVADGIECSGSELNDGLDVHKSTVSHHFKVLREAGVTSTRQEGRTRFIRLRREDLDARFPGLLDSVLNALE